MTFCCSFHGVSRISTFTSVVFMVYTDFNALLIVVGGLHGFDVFLLIAAVVHGCYGAANIWSVFL